METLVFALQVVIWPLCIVIVALILLQGGAGDISSAFGGGGQLDSTLGVGASRKMAKLTGWLAAIFAVIVLILAIPHKGSYRDTNRAEGADAKPAAGVMPAAGDGAMQAPGSGATVEIPAAPMEPSRAALVDSDSATAPAPAPMPVEAVAATAAAPAPVVEAPAATAAAPAPAPAAPAK